MSDRVLAPLHVPLPGGRITAEQLAALAEAVDALGDGHIEHAGRGGLRVPGVDADRRTEFAARLADTGLGAHGDGRPVPPVVVSPLAGRIGGSQTLWSIADQLDAALTDAAAVSELSDRCWFGLDDGRGDVLAHSPDVAAVWTGSSAAELVLGGRRTAQIIVLEHLAEALLAAARDVQRHAEPPAPQSRPAPRVGWFDQDDGRVLLGAVTANGRMTARQAQFAAAIEAPLIVTADRELLIADLTEGVAETVVRVLAPLGFSFDANSPWARPDEPSARQPAPDGAR